jgi:uncharacterized repeat protein (TIGR01451 family)
LEWSINPGGVGQFVDIGKNDFVDILLGDYNRPRLVNGVFGIGSTVSRDEQVKRGPSASSEEIAILPGQGWIKITSPIEGISSVAVTASKIVNPAERTKTATIYWTDATWRFPPPAINPAGEKHVFTTTVMRQTNQCPAPGWLVKYTVTGGPPAGFSPDGASSIEVATDAAGQANAEIVQKSPAHGTNQISIEVIRPAELPGAGGQRMTIGTGSTMQTWTAADIGLKLSGPSMAKAGDTLNYRLDVGNPGDLPSKNIVVSDVLPDGLNYLGSNPPAVVGGKQLQWRLGELGPRQRQTIEVSVRAEKEGSVSNCADVMTAAGLKVSDCATTTILAAAPIAGVPGASPLPTNLGSAPGEAPRGYPGVRAASPPASTPSPSPSPIDLKVQGPPNITLLRDKPTSVTFNVIVTNRSQSNLDNLRVKDRFEPGLEHEESPEKRVIETQDPINIPAGRVYKIDITFRVTKTGNLCHTVEIIRQDDVMARARACVMVSAQSTPPPGVAPPGGQIPSHSAPGATQGPAPGNKSQTQPGYRPGTTTTAPPPSTAAGVPTVTIKQSGPKTPQHAVGDVVSFVSRITNPNNRPLTNLKITYHFDPALLPKFATDHYRVEGGNLVWAIPQLPPRNYTQIEVQFGCVKAADKAGNSVSVSSSEGAQAEDTAYLEIRPAPGGAAAPGAATPGGAAPGGTALGGVTPGGTPWSARPKTDENQAGENRPANTAPKTAQSSSDLTMTVASLHPQVAVGKELTFLILVVNNTGLADRAITVTAVVPDEMIPVPLGTTGPGSIQPDIDHRTVSFNPVMSLQPNETLSYKVRVLARSVGQFHFRVKLTSQNAPQPIIQEADTEVIEGRGGKDEGGRMKDEG